MRVWAMTAAGACLLAMTMSAGADTASMTGASRLQGQPAIVLAQADKPKKESVTHKVERKVKRAWRNLTGYKFEVACLFSRTTCTETGKDRAEARGKCMQAHPLCAVNDAK
jgi:hypothetical protein